MIELGLNLLWLNELCELFVTLLTLFQPSQEV